MQGNDRHILFNGNYDLPEHKAPAELWEKIETMMLTVPASTLPVHKPPLNSWDAIEAGIGRNAGLRKSGIITLVALLLAILIGVTADRVFNNEEFSGRDRIENPNNQEAISDQKPLIVNNNPTAGIIMQDPGNSIVPESSNVAEETQSSESRNEENDINDLSNNVSLEDIPARNPGLLFLKPKSIDFVTGFRQNTQIKKSPIVALHANTPENTTANDQFYDCNITRTEHNFGIRAGIEYQHMLNSGIPENTKNKYWYDFDLRAFYQLNRFSIELGLGIGFSKDNINFSYNYLTNEIIDSYVYVDSAYYDPVSGTTHYFTTSVDVYDSIPYSDKSFVEKKYTYLQIPLELGFEIIKRKKFSLSIKGGMTYYKEIDRSEIYPDLYHENSRITKYSTTKSERRNEFFSLQGGLEFAWNADDRFQFTAKPSCKYFLNNIYLNDNNTKGVMSLGMRLGLRYKF